MSNQQEGSEGSNAGSSEKMKAQEYKTSGNLKFSESNFKEAVIEYRKGLMHDISNADLHINLSAAYFRLQKYVEASEHALYAIHLRPSFYKGYVQAAKASHGKGATNYGIKILKRGLKFVSDPLDVKGINKLLTQYTAYMSLRSNAERELEYASDTNESEEDNEPFSDENDDEPGDTCAPLPLMPPLVPASQLSNWESMDVSHGSNIDCKPNKDDYDSTTDNGYDEVNKNKNKSKKQKREEQLHTETCHPSKDIIKNIEPECTTESSKEHNDQSKLDKNNQKDMKQSLTTEDSVMLLAKDVSNEKKEVNISETMFVSALESNNPDLKILIAEFNDHLKRGSEAFFSKSYRKAADSFCLAEKRVINNSSWCACEANVQQCVKEVEFVFGDVKNKACLHQTFVLWISLQPIKKMNRNMEIQLIKECELDIRQLQIIRYVYATALINLDSYDDIVKGLQTLEKMTEHKSAIPAIYAQMTQAYCKLNRYKAAQVPHAQLKKVLEDCPIFPTFTWPGTNKTIEETTPSGLKKYNDELNTLCNMIHKPTAVCRYDNCFKISTHIVPSELIYNSDPDFVGYVRMTCEDKCSIEFHIPCWKAYKESTLRTVGKINDKDLLGHSCLTTDCVNSLGKPSVVVSIDIIGIDRKIKSSNKLDPKTATKTSKKRKLKMDEDKNKDKEKEKATKLKKLKEKKVPEMKKNVPTVDDEEEVLEDEKPPLMSPGKALAARKEALTHLRAINFGQRDKGWDPKLPCYGIPEETKKCANNQFLDDEHNDPVEVKDAKEFLFSYFMTMIRDEGPMEIKEIEEQWNESAGDFCDIYIVLPNLKSMRDLLLESTVFCQVENYICLSDQLEEQYELVKNITADVVTFFLNGSIAHNEGLAKTDIPTPLHDQYDNNKFTSQTSSDAEYNSNDEDSELEFANSDDNESECVEPEESKTLKETVPEVSSKSEIASHSNDFSFIDILNEMTRVKSNFMKQNEESITTKRDTPTENGNSFSNKDKNDISETVSKSMSTCILGSPEFSYDEQISNEDNTSDEDIVLEDFPDELESKNIVCEEVSDKILSDEVKQNLNSVESMKKRESTQTKADECEVVSNYPIAKVVGGKTEENCQESRCKSVAMKDREMQTPSSETKDTLSQTKEADYCNELEKKLEMLQSELEREKSDKTRLQKEMSEKDAFCSTLKSSFQEMKKSFEKSIKALKDESIRKETEYVNKEAEFKKKEKLQSINLEKLNNLYASISAENTKLQKEIVVFNTKNEKLQKSLESTKPLLRDYEKKTNTLEAKMKSKLIKSQKAQLSLIKMYWENQTNMLRRRCVEKISEMQSWFNMCPPDELKELPSLGDIRLNTMQWGEISNAVSQIEATVQAKFNELDVKIEKGEDLGDLSVTILPTLPEEPKPVPLDKIYKEITEKHVKKIGDLTQLVVNQQLVIEKSKEANVKIQQVMNTFQVSTQPCTQSPMTTAFGSLALKYPYPQFGQTHAGPATSDSVNDVNKLLYSDVQALLQESSKDTGHTSVPTLFGTLERSGSSAVPPLSIPNLFNTPPPPPPPPPLIPPLMPPTRSPPHPVSIPPPSTEVAQNLLKSSAISEKRDLQVDPPSSFKPEHAKTCASRESTSMPVQSSVLTPEKSKKKKKNRSESKDSELKGAVRNTISLPDCSADQSVNDSGDWNLVLPKSAVAKQATAAAPVPESKLKNKKRLLEKLQLRFPYSSMKELDDVVKLVREQNNGSLSGLPFPEIESRVERVVIKRQYNKSSPYGLEKLSSSAWGVIKQQETIGSSAFQAEECIICLEALGLEKTKTECNHQFHTKCLRKWLKEKRVCPLCNKFTTMPDEFPAL